MYTQNRTVTTLSFLIYQRILVPILLLFLLALTGCRPSQTKTQPLDEEFDAYVEQTLRDWQAPGVIISVVKDGKHVFAKGYGIREFSGNLPPDKNTLFHIASHSKAITAATVAMLVDEGKLDWNDPVIKYIPEFQFSDIYTIEKTTIRDILTHRTGLPHTIGSLRNPDYGFENLIDDLKTSKPVTGFREKHSYSNVGYAIAGEIVARVSGKSWKDFVTQRIFKPLDMTSSYTSTAHLRESLGNINEIENIFLPASKDGEEITPVEWGGFNSLYAPAGGVITTADDIAKWLIMQLQEGLYSRERLISAEAVREMHKPQVNVVPFIYGSKELDWAALHNPSGHFITYSFGWFSYDYRDRKVDEHTGLGANRSSIAVVPEENLGVAVCTNAHFSSPDVFRDMRMASALKLKIIDHFIDAPETDWSAEFLRIHQEEAARQAK